jgi:hypothetical protein
MKKLNKVFEDKLKDKTKDLFKNFGF